MNKPLLVAAVFVLTVIVLAPATAQQRASATRISTVDDNLITARQAVSQPSRRMRVAGLGNRSVRTGDNTTQSVRAIIVESFKEQETFAKRMNKAELVNAGALAALPEVDDEVLEFEDAYVIRRSTTIIVRDPERVARESTLFSNYIGERAQRKPQRAPQRAARQAVTLDAEERAGMQNFVSTEARMLHPDDPIRAAAEQGEVALLDAIEAGLGTLTVEDTLIIPKVAGVDQGQDIRIPTIRNGVLDLKSPEPVKNLPIKGMSVPPSPPPQQQLELKATPVTPKKPARAPSKPKLESSGKKEIDAEFLLGVTRAGNYQWERKWSYPSGFFRLTLGAGYAFGYRVPVVAEATVEPTRGYIQDYSDKKVIIGTKAKVKAINGNAAFYQRAGLNANQVKGGDELLLEANVGYGYKFRALWKTIRYRKYTAIGISYSQSFRPPSENKTGATNFGVNLDPKTTKISYDGTYVSGSATLRFLGKTWGGVSIDLQTLVDNKVQTTKEIKPPFLASQASGGGGTPVNITINPVPLRDGQSTQMRSFGVRLTDPTYKGRIVIVPGLKFSFGVGYKKLKRTFSTPWINFANLTIDTGNMTLKRHAGTPASHTWNDGEKIYRRIRKPESDPRTTIQQN
jgi:hypothetical protein